MRNVLLVSFLLSGAASYFMRDNVRSVAAIHPEALAEPLQTVATNTSVCEFTRNGYRYSVAPRYDYRITGLLVRKKVYGWWVIDRAEKVFPVDLCLLWGDNLRNNVHREPSVKFAQDCRWCWVRWKGNVPFNPRQMSNNHLLPADDRVEASIKRLHHGDQICLRGQLVNVNARLLDKGGRYDSEAVTWNSSVTRDDSGDGACEVIYVREVELLQPANQTARNLFRACLGGAAAMSLLGLIKIFRP